MARICVIAHSRFCTYFFKGVLSGLLNFFFFLFFFGHTAWQACGILVPQPGIKPALPALESRVLTTGLPGKSQLSILYIVVRVCSAQVPDLFLLN